MVDAVLHPRGRRSRRRQIPKNPAFFPGRPRWSGPTVFGPHLRAARCSHARWPRFDHWRKQRAAVVSVEGQRDLAHLPASCERPTVRAQPTPASVKPTAVLKVRRLVRRKSLKLAMPYPSGDISDDLTRQRSRVVRQQRAHFRVGGLVLPHARLRFERQVFHDSSPGCTPWADATMQRKRSRSMVCSGVGSILSASLPRASE